MMSDETFNNVNKCNEFVVVLYVPYWLQSISPISDILNDLELISHLNQFSDTKYCKCCYAKI